MGPRAGAPVSLGDGRLRWSMVGPFHGREGALLAILLCPMRRAPEVSCPPTRAGARRIRAHCPTNPGGLPCYEDRVRVVEDGPRADTEGVPTRVLIVATVLLSATAAALSAWLFSWPQEDALATVLGFQVGGPFDALVGMSWLLTGACLAWLRPRNALGWLLIGIGGCQVFGLLAAAYGSLGVFVGDPDWPGARWAAWLSS